MPDSTASPPSRPPASIALRVDSPAGRWVIAATVLGSGMAFLDSTVVNVALPAIRDDLGGGVTGLQWTVDAYLLTLSALLLFGGSLGDVLGRRRVFVGGLVAFVSASAVCAVAPDIGLLIAARAVQGVGAAFLVPASLAIIAATFHPDDRGRAIGAWSGLSGVASAIGPFVGGWVVDAVSWRLVFLLNLPLAAVTGWLAVRHVPETRDPETGRPDWLGAVAITVGLSCVTYALIEGPVRPGPWVFVLGVVGVVAIGAVVVIEQRVERPMLPFAVFRSRRFSGANATTFAVYGALGGALFLIVLQLQLSLGYSALEAGTSLLPVTVLLLVLSPTAGAIGQRVGPRLPMTIGPLVAAVGLLLFTRVRPGAHYATTVLPAATVFGLGLAITVAPLTNTVLSAVSSRFAGAGSGVNNAVARLAGLLAVAVLPALSGFDTTDTTTLTDGFVVAMRISAVLCVAGASIAACTVGDEPTGA
jgi:EmrB/QacA subfamily drug resistance transporter